MMWDFIKHIAPRPSTEPPPRILSSDDEDYRDGAVGDGNDVNGVADNGSRNAS